MKIVIAHFSAHWVNMSGGVEKTVCALSNAMVARGHEVTVLYLGDMEGAPYFPLDERVKTQNILFENGEAMVMDKLPWHLRVYREIARIFDKTKAREINARHKGRQYGAQIRKWFSLHEADVVLSVSPISAAYLLIDGACKTPVIEMTREDPATGFPGLSAREKRAIRKAKIIQVLWPEDLDIAADYFPDVPAVAIGNAIEPAKLLAKPGKKKSKYKITNVGSVCSRKNQKCLVEAFAGLATEYPEWMVEIWGVKDSFYGKSLQKYIERHSLEKQIILRGVTRNVAKVYAESDIFAYPSESEGFPNGVIEAMAAGIPVIGLKKCHGTNYLVKDGKTGFLTDNSVESFRKALKTLMDDAELRDHMGQAGLAASARYAPNDIWNQWEFLMRQICGNFEQGEIEEQ